MDLNLTLYENFLKINQNHLSFKAITYLNRDITYHEIFANIDKIASFYHSLNLKENDFITIVSPNIPEAVYAFFAAEKMGLKIHLLHPLIGKNLLKEEIENKNSKLLITLDIFSKKYQEIISYVPTLLLSPASSLNIIKRTAFNLLNKKNIAKNRAYHYQQLSSNFKGNIPLHYDNKKGSIYLSSGGTTGKSKTIELSDYAILSLLSQTYHILDKDIIDNHYLLAVLPMFHGFGLVMGILTPLFFNAKINMMPSFHTKPVIKEIKKNKINAMIGVPLIYEALLKNKNFDGKILKNLLVCFVGGDFISPSLLSRFNQKMKDNHSTCLLLEGYGLTETVTVCNVNTLKEHKDKTVGKPLPNVQNYILDENNHLLPPYEIGEIALGGETLMNGYLDEKSPFITIDNQKIIKTGDLGYLDEDNYLYFVSRKKNVIIHKGFNIYPLMIEKQISLLPYVKEVSYFELDYKIYLYLSLKGNNPPLEVIKKEINTLIKDNFLEYCLPNQIKIIDNFPYTNVGKIDVKKLKELERENNK